MPPPRASRRLDSHGQLSARCPEAKGYLTPFRNHDSLTTMNIPLADDEELTVTDASPCTDRECDGGPGWSAVPAAAGAGMTVSTSYFAFEGDRLAYTRQGSGSPVLFFSNMGSTKEAWVLQAEALRHKFEVICLDHIGLGESDIPATPYSVEKYATMLSAFIDHLDVEKISVVGNCMGSAMMLLLADRRPEKFDRLFLINPASAQTLRRSVLFGGPSRVLTRFSRVIIAASRLFWLPKIFGRIAVALQYGPRGWRRGMVHRLPGAAAIEATLNTRGRTTATLEILSDPVQLGQVDRLEPGPDFPRRMVVWGESNLVLSAKAGRELNRTLRPEREVYLPGRGHLPMIESPEEITALIDDFLTEQKSSVTPDSSDKNEVV
ncbi:alpha/beta fold hydrolase, partial [Mycobacteroides chelonae]